MKAVLTVYVCVMLGAAASAQSVPGCEKCGVVAFVDVPAQTVTVSNADLLARHAAIEGWGFECVSGDPVNRVDVWVEDDAHPEFWHPVPNTNPNASTDLTWGGYNARPDVEAAFVAACPAILYRPTGFVRWLDHALPLGAHRFKFVLWRGPYHADLVRTWTVQ